MDIQTFSTVPYRAREYGAPYRTHKLYSCLILTYGEMSLCNLITICGPYINRGYIKEPYNRKCTHITTKFQ